MDDIYQNIDRYRINKKQKISIVFYDLIADIFSKKYSTIDIIIYHKHKNMLVLQYKKY